MGVQSLKVANPRRLWTSYVLACALVVSCLIANYALQEWELRRSARDAETINVSGRQRMLSQRAVLLAERYMETGRRGYRELLVGSLREFRAGHQWVLDHAVNSPEARAHYFDPAGAEIDALSKSFLEAGEALLRAEPQSQLAVHYVYEMERMAVGQLLVALDSGVKFFETEANASRARLRDFQRISLLAVIAVLCLEAWFIFRPSHRAVVSALDRIEAQNRRLEDQTEVLEARNADLTKLSARLERTAYFDEVTGLANRKKLYLALPDILSKAQGNGQCVCIMHGDLDRFKQVNDALGHAVGDGVLQVVSERMRAVVRPTDLVGRIGGDEFVVALTLPKESAQTRAAWLADSMIEAVAAPIQVGGNECGVGLSIGYVMVDGPSNDAQDLIADADIALYEAKRSGRGIAVPFFPRMR
ncbi:MAG: diguanylate cyclase, partial [Pseudomonadota bacterium]